MPSPFPGMDPYLESWIWGEFHSHLVTRIYETLNLRLPKGFIAFIGMNIPTRPGIVKKQKYVKIVDADDRRVVTVIEVLSPSNKSSGEDGQHYRLKREAYIANGVSLVEIDLLRSGQRPPLGDPSPPISDYYLLVHRGWERSRLGIWPLSIRDPFPSQIPFPLDPDVAEATLDLRACMDHVYDIGRYAEQLDYSKPPKPPLREPDAAWAR